MRTARLVAAAALAGAALTGLPAAPAAATPSHVAITVAGDRSACVSWHSGMTGTDVLVAAGYHLTWGQRPPYQGMLLQIDGAPASPNPQQAYWAYFENGSYSATGPASSTPAAGSVEGWRYVPADGSTPSGPGGSYASICAGKDAAPSTKPAPKPPAAPAPPAKISVHAPPSARQSTAAPRPAVRSSVPHRSATAPPSTASAAVSAAAVGAASTPTPDPRSASPVAHSRTTSGGQPPWGTLIGVAAVLVLGAGGFWFSRRRAGP